MCKEQYNIKVIAKLADNTVGLYMALDNLLDQNFALSKEASEKIGNVVLIIQRVVLSTNANIEFYTVTVVDKKMPSIEFKLTVHVRDIKRALTLDISRGEYYERIVRDLKLNLSSLMNAENFSVEPIKLPAFLAEQVANRIKYGFEQDKTFPSMDRKVYPVDKTLRVNKTYGTFKDGHFLFSLDVVRKTEEGLGYLPLKKNKEILEESFKVIDFILRRYSFKDFKEIELRNAGGKEILRIKKEDLPTIRWNKKLIDNYIF